MPTVKAVVVMLLVVVVYNMVADRIRGADGKPVLPVADPGVRLPAAPR